LLSEPSQSNEELPGSRYRQKELVGEDLIRNSTAKPIPPMTVRRSTNEIVCKRRTLLSNQSHRRDPKLDKGITNSRLRNPPEAFGPDTSPFHPLSHFRLLTKLTTRSHSTPCTPAICRTHLLLFVLIAGQQECFTFVFDWCTFTLVHASFNGCVENRVKAKTAARQDSTAHSYRGHSLLRFPARSTEATRFFLLLQPKLNGVQG